MPLLDSPPCQFPLILKVFSAFSENKLPRNRCSADPAAAEDDVAVVENSGLAGGDGALRGIECDARDGDAERLDCGGRGGGLLGGFFSAAQAGGAPVVPKPNVALHFLSPRPPELVLAVPARRRSRT